MPDRKPSIVPWVAGVVALLAAYPLSAGPAQTALQYGLIPVSLYDLIYEPLWEASESTGTAGALAWYVTQWPGGH